MIKMNGTITSREELLLAKLAGENVNINTMTPPVAMNKKEKLLLDIATRLDSLVSGSGSGSGSGGDVFIVNGEVEHVGNDDTAVVSIDKTTEQIYAAAASGKPVILLVAEGEDDISQWMFVDAGEGKDDDIYADFMSILEDKDGIALSILTFHSDGDPAEIEWYEIPVKDDVGFEPFYATGVMTLNGSGKKEMPLSMNGNSLTAADAYALIKKGKKCIMSFSAGGSDTECVVGVTAFKTDNSGTVTYTFRVDTDTTYVASSLSASDQVVFVET